MKIAVVALGKIGLPLAVQYASMGHTVIGIDVNKSLVDKVNSGVEPFPGEFGLAHKLKDLAAKGQLTATTEYSSAIPDADAIVVVVPLLIDESNGEPDFSLLDSATHSIGTYLSPGTLVSFETTLPVGTTRNRWKPMLEDLSGLVEGKDFHLVFSPERVLTGRVFSDLKKYPKLVGGLSPLGSQNAIDFYESVLTFDNRVDLARPNGVWDMGTAEAAEMAKLAETTYRDVNIGLSNQFAMYSDKSGIDFYKVIEACNSQPYSHLHKPGIAVGGHCIPVYPRLYLAGDSKAEIVQVARKANLGMPEYLISRVEDLLGSLSGLSAVILGASYRGGVKETALSGVFPTSEELIRRGVKVSVHDPLYSEAELSQLGLKSFNIGDEVDIVILQADHEEYLSLVPEDFPGIKVFADGRNFTNPTNWFGTPRIVIGQ